MGDHSHNISDRGKSCLLTQSFVADVGHQRQVYIDHGQFGTVTEDQVNDLRIRIPMYPSNTDTLLDQDRKTTTFLSPAALLKHIIRGDDSPFIACLQPSLLQAHHISIAKLR